MKALIDRLKKSNEFLNLFTLYNVFDADATDNIRRCILKNELAVYNCEKLVNEVSTIDEALPIADVGETLSKHEFQLVMKRELEGFREMNIFDLSDEAGELLASSIWDDHKVIER